MLIAVKNASGVATEEQIALVRELDSMKRLRDDAKGEVERIQNAIIATLGEVNRVLKENGKPLITLSPTTTNGSFDRSGLLAKYPDIHAEFWTPGGTITGTRLTVTP
mgnify:CR=1 FL=1